MWPDGRLIERLGLRHPIVQAPMAGASSPAMAAAAANAGALGSVAAPLLTLPQMRAEWAEARAATNGALALNFFCHRPPARDAAREAAARERLRPFYDEFALGPVPEPAATPPFDAERLAFVLEARPAAVSFHFGLPAPDLLAPLKAAGIFILSSATSPAEAVALEAAGADAVIAQGWEAGGHRGVHDEREGWGEMGAIALVPAIVDRVSVPVIAAGGIGDGRGIAAAMMLGAAGAQLGTAFLLSPESRIAEPHRAALRASDGADTAVTAAFSGRPARGVRNRYMAEMGAQPPADFPLMNPLTAPLRAASAKAGSPDLMSLWSGQAPFLAREEGTGEIVERLAREALARLGRG
ncbi:MAG: NAD(P)H-dependent flavin oxidoreductase [Pikeienuella sp.]|uniref:NAD(P)H-dependent flavin oxidoreductase n=1 Tax=Pikeienuella sp. TaxID=2831957 RepID=UPI00391AEFDC